MCARLRRRTIPTARSRWWCRSRPAARPTAWRASSRTGSAQVLGQSIVIENRGGGAGGSIGAKVVAAADPDGYTILLTPGGSLTTGPAVHKNIGYDPAKAFTPVAPAHRDAADPVACIRTLPVKIDGRARGLCQGQSGQGQLGLARLRRGAASPHSSCSSSRPASTSCTCPIAAPRPCSPPSSQARSRWSPTPMHHQPAAHPIRQAAPDRDARLRALTETSRTCRPRRRRAFPRSNAPFWLGVVAPAGTPPAIVDKLNAAFRESMAPPETRARLAKLGAEIKIGTPADVRQDARQGACAVDRRRQGRQDHGANERFLPATRESRS